MSWTGGKVAALKFLYRSFWSRQAIAVATAMTIGAVNMKIKRLHRAGDIDIEFALFARRLARAAGLKPLTIGQAKASLTQPGVRAGLLRLTQSERKNEMNNDTTPIVDLDAARERAIARTIDAFADAEDKGVAAVAAFAASVMLEEEDKALVAAGAMAAPADAPVADPNPNAFTPAAA